MISTAHHHNHFRRLICVFFIISLTTSINLITPTQFLTGNQTLLSAGEQFELGFFTPGNTNNYYIGIWYKQIDVRTFVWVANRDKPLRNSTGILRISSDDNNLVITDSTGNTLWSSNLSINGNPVAELLDNGNFILRQSNDEDPENYLWQSFDHPTDTMLPGMKLGWDAKSGLNRYITSWKSIDDPSTGDYSFKLDINGFPEIYLTKKQSIDYRSGPWNGLRFSGVPEMTSNSPFTFLFVMNQDEVFYSFDLSNKSVYSRLIIRHWGALQRWTWISTTSDWNLFWYAPRDQCDDFRECGVYGICDTNASPVCKCLKGFVPRNLQAWNLRDGSDGCVRVDDLDCGSDGFLILHNVKLPESGTAFVDKNMNLNECGVLCKRNCSCMGYSNANITGGGTGCVIWAADLYDMRQYAVSEGGQDFYLRVPEGDLDHSGENGEDEFDLPLIDLNTIVISTNNFSDANKLGQGGFGCVYKGILTEGEEIAVKRLSKSSGQGIEEFKNEVKLIARLQHRNLVRLLGCCVEMEEKMLIYEYMENKSLDSFLFNKDKGSLLDWQRRFKIICGIARGLLYLHQDSRFRIIHRDLKASNILLDKEMNPKISDFGMARIFGADQTEANTKRVVGTYGYMSPEYAMDGLFSIKSDVFSFGVLVLEIVSGKKNRGFYQTNNQLNLLSYAWKLYREGRGIEVMDSAAGESFSGSEVMRCIQVGLLCVQEHAEDRPNMSTVVLMLSSDCASVPQPKHPGYCLGRRPVENDSSSSKQDESCTVNQVTVTVIDGR
ncbi:hypothetical protein ACJIZ3_013127 [Penstemon smallii]|uniref:Receptor-like serine/threonine-protein kinase n=1 Tax=Penstemon smallii TaxID=265156 RepID=A0ABD3USH4_9LAMI